MEKKELKKYLIIAVIIIGICLIVKNFSAIALAIKVLLSALSPLFVGCAIAYVFNIFLSYCEKYYFPKQTTGFAAYSRRPVCMVISFAVVTSIIALILKIVIPELVTAVKLITSEIPQVALMVKNWILRMSKEFPDIYDQLIDTFNINLNELSNFDWNDFTSKILNRVGSGVEVIFTGIASVIGAFTMSVTNFVIALIFAIYLLARKDKIMADIRRTKNAFLNETTNKLVSRVFRTANDTFKNFFVGQFVEAIILGSLCMIGMTILGFPYAAMTGAVIGVTALIPIVGAYIGAAVGAFMICTESPIKALWFIVFLIILQQIEGNLIYPKVVGSSVGLPGIWVLAAVTVGGGLFGIAGMLLGVPTLATVYKLYHESLEKREEKCGIALPEPPKKPEKPEKTVPKRKRRGKKTAQPENKNQNSKDGENI